MQATWGRHAATLRGTVQAHRFKQFDQGRARQHPPAVDRQLKEYGAGSLRLETIGFLWLLVGVVLANFGDSLAALFTY